MITSNTSKTESTAAISGGVTKDGGLTYSNLVFPGDTISIRPVIEPDKKHLGKLLEIIVILESKDKELFLLTNNSVIPYTLNDSISPFSQVIGTPRLFVPILDEYKYTGGGPYAYDIYVGYRLADKTDEIFYNLEPIKMSLN